LRKPELSIALNACRLEFEIGHTQKKAAENATAYVQKSDALQKAPAIIGAKVAKESLVLNGDDC
jgi:hypothetical protein